MVVTPSPLTLKLRHSGYLDEDDGAALDALCARPRMVEAGIDVVREGDPPGPVHLIDDGFACRYKTLPDGQRQILGLLLPGDFCDLQSGTLRYLDHSIATLTPCAIVELPQKTVDELTLAPTRIARAFWWGAVVDESIQREWLANIGQRPAAKRLAHLFQEVLLRLHRVGRADAHACECPFTLSDMSEMLGLTAVHVSRVLRELREARLITLSQRHLDLPNPDRLRAFCDFDARYLHLREGDAGEPR